MKSLQISAFIFILLLPLTSLASDPFEVKFEEVSDNVWAGIRPDAHVYPVVGNTTFVIGDQSVLVFDGGGRSITADKVIKKIKSLTSLPVSHVIISHWHPDHSYGIHRYAEQFSNVQFIAHTFTDKKLAELKNSIDKYPSFFEKKLRAVKEQLETGKKNGKTLSFKDRTENEHILSSEEDIRREYQLARLNFPTIVIDNDISISLGTRKVEIKHIGHGNTDGDLIMWLADEKIVAVGDIVVAPSPYAFNVQPKLWIETLNKINHLDYSALIPGHGEVQRDNSYVNLVIDVLKSGIAQRDKMLKENIAPDVIQEKMDFSDFEPRFTAGDPYLQGFYIDYFERPIRKSLLKEISD